MSFTTKTTRVQKISPFLLAKCLKDKIGPTYKTSKMSSGDLLLELNGKVQLQKLSELTNIGKDTVTTSAHHSLNTSRGIISEEDFLSVSDEELLEGFQERSVVEVQRIVIHRNDQEVPTKLVILTFGTIVMLTSPEAGCIKVSVQA